MVPVTEGDREWHDQPTPADEHDQPTPADEDVGDLGGGAYADEPPRRVGPRGDPKLQNEQDKWRRLALTALIIVTVGGGWALVLVTILVDRSGDRTAELISLFEAGQQQRQGALGGVQQSQKERQAALETQQQQSQMLRAQELAALADQARGNAETRQALANAALATSRARQAEAEAALAQAQSEETQARTVDRRTPAQVPTGQRRAEAQATLTAAIEALRAAIEQLGNRGPRR